MAHKAVLTWLASPDAGSFGSGDGYVVFRGTAQGQETTQLTPSPITALTFTDITVSEGVAYWYAVKSSLNGVLSSALEAEASVILPAAPTGPLNIVVS